MPKGEHAMCSAKTPSKAGEHAIMSGPASVFWFTPVYVEGNLAVPSVELSCPHINSEFAPCSGFLACRWSALTGVFMFFGTIF